MGRIGCDGRYVVDGSEWLWDVVVEVVVDGYFVGGESFVSEIGGKDERSVHDGCYGWVVLEGFGIEMHWEGNGDAIACCPFATDGEIAVLRLLAFHFLAIDGNSHVFAP